ncbi:MAG: hypothetical protein ACTHM9_13600 [Gemmatimonadales bacterium]
MTLDAAVSPCGGRGAAVHRIARRLRREILPVAPGGHRVAFAVYPPRA